MMQRIKAKVTQKEYLSPEIIRYRLETPIKIDFQPGQFMSMAVEGYVRRSYSLANSPTENTFVETFTDITPMGPGSRFINDSQVGDLVDVMVPLGKFVYLPGDDPVYLFATGTGIVPFISMIRHELLNLRSGREVSLYHGVRSQSHLIEMQNFRELAKKHGNFHYIPVVSKPTEEWQGKIGRVTHFLPQVGPKSDIYICGGREALLDIEDGVLARGATKERIYYERFY